MQLDQLIFELEDLSPTNIEDEIAALVRKEFSISARLERARRQHRPSKKLSRYFAMMKALELAA